MMESDPKYYSYADGAAYPFYSSETERKECETFRNIERKAAYELRQAGHTQPIIWRAK